jgi:hypothetical protein
MGDGFAQKMEATGAENLAREKEEPTSHNLWMTDTSGSIYECPLIVFLSIHISNQEPSSPFHTFTALRVYFLSWYSRVRSLVLSSTSLQIADS